MNCLEAPKSEEGLNLVDQVNLSASIEQVNLDSWPDSDENLPWATRNSAGSTFSSILFYSSFLSPNLSSFLYLFLTNLFFPIHPNFPSLFNHTSIPVSYILFFPIHPFFLPYSSILPSFPIHQSFLPYSFILPSLFIHPFLYILIQP